MVSVNQRNCSTVSSRAAGSLEQGSTICGQAMVPPQAALALPLVMTVDEFAQCGVDTGLVALALALKPIEDIGIDA